MTSRRTHVVISEELISEIDTFVGKRGRSQFLAEAARKELKRLKMVRALEQAAGAWQTSDHPELKDGAAQWVAALRKTDEERLSGKSRRR